MFDHPTISISSQHSHVCFSERLHKLYSARSCNKLYWTASMSLRGILNMRTLPSGGGGGGGGGHPQTNASRDFEISIIGKLTSVPIMVYVLPEPVWP